MNDDEVIRVLRNGAEAGSTPVQLATLLGELTHGEVSQGTLITFFKVSAR